MPRTVHLHALLLLVLLSGCVSESRDTHVKLTNSANKKHESYAKDINFLNLKNLDSRDLESLFLVCESSLESSELAYQIAIRYIDKSDRAYATEALAYLIISTQLGSYDARVKRMSISAAMSADEIFNAVDRSYYIVKTKELWLKELSSNPTAQPAAGHVSATKSDRNSKDASRR